MEYADVSESESMSDLSIFSSLYSSIVFTVAVKSVENYLGVCKKTIKLEIFQINVSTKLIISKLSSFCLKKLKIDV